MAYLEFGPARAERNIQWIQEYCRIPEGRDAGKQVVLRPWQKKIIRGIYGSTTRRAIISFGRKNAKTALSCFLLLLHTAGPESVINSQLYSAAQSKEQAAILFRLAAKSIRFSPELAAEIIIRDTLKELYCPGRGTLYKALAAEATTTYGFSSAFTVHDELGQVVGPTSELYEALETSSGAHEEPLSIVISTQATTDNDLLSILIDDAKAGHDPETKLFLYTFDGDEELIDPFSEDAIKAANPAYGDFLNSKETLKKADDAKRMPSREAAYRNLVLNQRCEALDPFVTKTVWQANGGEVQSYHGKIVYGGLDLASVNDLCALTMVHIEEALAHVNCVFWLPGDNIEAKSRADRVPYNIWADQGYLETTPGTAVEYEYIARRLKEIYDACDTLIIGFDRFNIKHLKPWLISEGFTEEQVEEVFKPFGQGFTSMSPALRGLEEKLLTGKMRHGNHPVLTMCAANAKVQKDPAGNRKFTKSKSAGRIDGMVSLAMSIGVMPEEAKEEYVTGNFITL